MKCDELKAYKGDVTIPVYGSIADADVYLKDKVDEAIAELKNKLMPCLNGDCILTCEVVEKYGKENAELKAKLEDVNELIKESKELLKESQKMHQRCADGATKKIRHQKFKRCLAMAMWCWAIKELNRYGDQDYMDFAEKWRKRWLKLAEKFKEAK